MTSSVSKNEYLKRYLEPKKGRNRKFEDVTVKYISGDLPETLDAFYNDQSEAFPFSADHEEAPTVVRKTTLSKAEKGDKSKELSDKKKEAEIQARYDVWNRGIKTLEETYAKLKEQQYESSKPLARYADDADLTEHLKSKLHADDPMAEYFAKKKKKHEKPKKKKKKEHEKHPKPEEGMFYCTVTIDTCLSCCSASLPRVGWNC
ncbi:unnamed protein product [Dicrocoelium dendriticum]|nr:unnamed protein product [Dicrocoelium dendriticum]